MRSVFLLLILGASACTKIESESVLTSGMSARMTVGADGNDKTVAHAFVMSGTNYVDLQGNDSLIVSSGSTSKKMEKNVSIVNSVEYMAEFTNLDQEGTPFVISFNRKVDKGAPNSSCTLPKPFSITAPLPNATFSREQDAVVLSWAPAGTNDAFSYLVDGPCIKGNATTTAPDTGSLTVPKDVLAPRDQQHASESCTITVTMIRERAGQLDPAFGHGGTIAGRQERVIQFTSKP